MKISMINSSKTDQDLSSKLTNARSFNFFFFFFLMLTVSSFLDIQNRCTHTYTHTHIHTHARERDRAYFSSNFEAEIFDFTGDEK